MTVLVNNIVNEVGRQPDYQVYGQVTAIVGLLVEIGGVQGGLSIGDHCRLIGRDDRRVICEVVGFRDGRALVMPFGALDGIGLGCRAEIDATDPVIHPDNAWLGRVINAFPEPIGVGGPLPGGRIAYPVHNQPPPAHARNRVGEKVDLGVRAMNTFLTTCKGQRMGIFAGSGVGKSTLLSMMARHTNSEINVIGPLKIYVVDDEAQIVEFMTVALESAGHTMFADISAVFAISRIVEKKPDCLITDLMMSELNGVELCKLLRQRSELKDLVIIFVSAQGSDYWKQRAVEAGADGYIVKPLRAESFVQEVEDIIRDAKSRPGNAPRAAVGGPARPALRSPLKRVGLRPNPVTSRRRLRP